MADSIADRSSTRPQNRYCIHNCSKKILGVNLVYVSLVFHGGSEKCVLAGSWRKEETLANKIRCDVKPDSVCHWERFSTGFLWMKKSFINFVIVDRCDT